MYLLNRLGRKKLYIGYMLIGGIACIGTIYPVVQSAEGMFVSILLNLFIFEGNLKGLNSVVNASHPFRKSA